ncbi:hypothetical protein PF003_g39864 [Phytophthora fragariae]|nr:hypothetical protein PF003_g39864 [Phytophthora fragariae]
MHGPDQVLLQASNQDFFILGLLNPLDPQAPYHFFLEYCGTGSGSAECSRSYGADLSCGVLFYFLYCQGLLKTIQRYQIHKVGVFLYVDSSLAL